MRKKIETAVDRVGRKAGGLSKLAEWCGVHRTRPYHWNKSRKHSQWGRDGAIPDIYFPAILREASEKGIRITKSDLVNG